MWRSCVSALLLLQLLLACAVGTPSAQPSGAASDPSALIERSGDGLSRWSSRAKPLLAAAAPDNSTSAWMGNMASVLGPLTLRDMILPGTHDSGAYVLTDGLAPDITGSEQLDSLISLAEQLGLPVEDVITPWALSQRSNLYEQAVAGARYFDLRVCWNGTHLVTFHFETGQLIESLVSDLARFAKANPTEILVVETQIFVPPDGNGTLPDSEKVALGHMLTTAFAGMLYPEEKSFTKSYADLISSNQRVLISVNDALVYSSGVDPSSGRQMLWWGPGSADDSPGVIFNSYADNSSLAFMEGYNLAMVHAFNAPPPPPSNASWPLIPAPCVRNALSDAPACMFKLSWTLTTDEAALWNSLTPPNPTSLLALAGEANGALGAFVDNPAINEMWLAHILIADDFTGTGTMVLQVAMAQNEARGRAHAMLSRQRRAEQEPAVAEQ